MAREINLVPDIKGEMIKALKIRNLTFFICLIVCASSIAAILIFAGIAAGQQAAVDGKRNTLATLSQKLNEYSDLSDFLTIKDQLGNLSDISSNKKMLSRTFDVLSALIPTGADRISLSELNIDLTADYPTITIEAQANAGQPPYIDYNVLDSFKKSMQYMRYDYGTYVDKNGRNIPAYCMIESGENGATFSDPERGYYALWLITGDGCNPSVETDSDVDSGTTTDGELQTNLTMLTDGYITEEYNGQTVVRIWRTPQFNEWYRDKEEQGKPYMGIDGHISGIEHFESKCIAYSGTKTASSPVSWSSVNNSCYLVPGGTDGIVISDSSNGRDSSNELVLRFSATIALDPKIFQFANTHMLALGPSGRYNVTDSYVQIQNMFGQRAKDCTAEDSDCASNKNGEN